MSVKKIYLIRHGQTDHNLQGLVQGSGIDSSLNALGRLQAAAFYDAYKHIRFDKIYTSALQRTHQSVQSFLEKGCAHEALPALNEISWGVKEGQRFSPADDPTYLNLINCWVSGDHEACIEGGESPNKVAARQRPFIELLKSRPEEETVLICMHGRAMRVLLCQLLNYPLRYMEVFEHHNLCLYKLNFTGSLFYIKRFCDVRHLENLKD